MQINRNKRNSLASICGARRKSFPKYRERINFLAAAGACPDLFNVIMTPLIFFHFSIKKVLDLILRFPKKRPTREEVGRGYSRSKVCLFIFFADALFKSSRNFANFPRPSLNGSLFTLSCFRYIAPISQEHLPLVCVRKRSLRKSTAR